MKYPPLGPVGYLVEYLLKLGPMKSGAAIEPQDMQGWEYVLGVEFDPWEMQTLIDLSRAYHTEMHEAEAWDREPPYRGAANQWKRLRRQQTQQNEKRNAELARAEAAEQNPRRKPRGDRQ